MQSNFYPKMKVAYKKAIILIVIINKNIELINTLDIVIKLKFKNN